MRSGLFIPQGWRHDLVGIAPADQWKVMSDLATYADQGQLAPVFVGGQRGEIGKTGQSMDQPA